MGDSPHPFPYAELYGCTLHRQRNIPSAGLANVHVDLVWPGDQGFGSNKNIFPVSRSGAA